jgi:uncharacterized phiE125 gp8 family phage protein
MDTRIETDITTEPVLYADVAQFIKFSDPTNTAEVTLIENMIKACRQLFERRCGLSFKERTYETLFKPFDRPYIIPITPVISVDKVETVDYTGTKTELTLNSGYYKRGLYQVEIQTSEMTGLSSPWTSGAGSYDLLVTYKAGYGHTDTETLPEALKEAMRRQVMQWYDNRDDFYELKLLGSIESILRSYMAFII